MNDDDTVRARRRAQTISSTFGADAANELAAVAIDLLAYPPAEIRTHSTRIRASEVRRGREIMERHGIHWRALVADDKQRRRKARERAHA